MVTRSKQWWGRLFGRFGHVDAIVRSNGLWVHYAPGLDVTQITAVNDWREAVPEDADVYRFRVLRKGGRYRVPMIFAPFTCVEQIKALLGIRTPWVLTPRQLVRRVCHG